MKRKKNASPALRNLPTGWWKKIQQALPIAMSGLLVALALSWLLLAQVNFSYGFWHDHAGIGAAIDEYGPANQYKKAFHLTDREQRIELFAGINRAIHSSGQGLQDLAYTVPGYPEQRLLREPELVHLQDVSNLIDKATYAALFALVLWVCLLVYYVRSCKPVPTLKFQLMGTLLLIAVIAILVVIIGPVKVFYKLHEVIFPDGHQWFFYYQESLMSTMMKAPDLFGWIAVEWLSLAILCFVGLQIGADRFVRLAQNRWKK